MFFFYDGDLHLHIYLTRVCCLPVYEDNQKVFIKAQVDLNVALGQLLKVRLLAQSQLLAPSAYSRI
jgi:hypothetical protein